MKITVMNDTHTKEAEEIEDIFAKPIEIK